MDLALRRNNLAIVIERYTPWIAEANVLRTLSGAPSLSGTVQALGSIPALSFDPQVTSVLSLDARTIPVNNPLTAGTGGAASFGTFSTLNSHTTVGNLQYSQGFHTGTSFSAAFNNTRGSSSSTATFFDPFVQSNFVFTASQQLLNGFGLLANEHYIRIAKVNKNIADQSLVQQSDYFHHRGWKCVLGACILREAAWTWRARKLPWPTKLIATIKSRWMSGLSLRWKSSRLRPNSSPAQQALIVVANYAILQGPIDTFELDR